MLKIYKWCAHLGKAGIDAIEDMWGSHKKYENPGEHKAYIEFALGSGLPFMYGKVEHLGGDHYQVCFSDHLL
jgi:hypothetical protein